MASNPQRSARLSPTDGRAMLIGTPGRLAYLGRFGSHDRRIMAAATLYVAVRSPFIITIGNEEREAMLALVPAHAPHRVRSEDGFGAQIVIEPETIDDPILTNGRPDICYQRALASRILAGFGDPRTNISSCSEFDLRFLGVPLRRRKLDHRIRTVVERISADPAEKHSAEACAHSVSLSVSRFSHLFRSEVGSTFRNFCAWKRVRGVMEVIKSEPSLVDTALAAGYADSTHFCHSMRHFFGIRPSDLSNIMTPDHFRLAIAQGERAALNDRTRDAHRFGDAGARYDKSCLV